MSELDLLEKAIGVAVEAHRGQKDRYGAPYILHPLRVMNRLDSALEQIVGILHDVVEDTDWTFQDLAEAGFPDRVIEALKCVTKKDGEDYQDFVKRSASDPLASKVKIADLEDNMNLRRAPELSAADNERFAKYVRAWHFLHESANTRAVHK